MGILSKIAETPLLAIWLSEAITRSFKRDLFEYPTPLSVVALTYSLYFLPVFNTVGPALEPLLDNGGLLGRVAYYSSQRRFRDWFVPMCAIQAILGIRCAYFGGSIHGSLEADLLNSLGGSWIIAYCMTSSEAVKFANRPYNKEEKRLWTEGMTRREFLERRRA